MVTRTGMYLILAAGALALAAGPAASQTHRSAFSVSGGWASYEDLTPGLATETRLQAGWLAGVQLEKWSGSGRTGIRLNGTFTERPLEGNPESDFNVYAADLDLLLRLLPAGRERWLAPFIALGAGGVRYDAPGTGNAIAGGAYGEDPVMRPHVLAGFGFDVGPSDRLGLRLEASDQVVFPSVGESPLREGVPMVHNPRFQAGLQIRAGRLHPRQIVAAGRPAQVVARNAPTRAAPAASKRPSAPLGIAVAQPDPETLEAVARLEQALMQREREQARELSRLEERVSTLEREVRERPAMAAAPAPSTAASAAPSAAAAGPGRYTVQVGAFVELETARLWAERLERRNLPVWLEDFRVKGQPVKRVRVGALPSRAEAERLAARLERDYRWEVWVVALNGGEDLPASAVRSTLAFLSAL